MNIAMPGYEIGEKQTTIEIVTFPDGEQAVGVLDVAGKDVRLYGGCFDANSTEVFLAAAYELARRGPDSLTIYNYYFRNARCERRFGDQAVMAKFQAQLWSGVGRLYPGARLVLLDLHTDLVLNYFEGAVFPHHVTAIPMLLDKAFAANSEDRILATVDTGQIDEIRIQAERLGVGLAYIEKRRLSATETEVEGVYGDPVEGKHVIIVDDVIATAGSLCNAAAEYAKLGAKTVSALAAHGLFAGDALTKLADSPIVRVDVTNSHPAATSAATASQFVHVHRLDRTALTPAR
tara:strand:+ start:591 stop:1463 length:873 start_codon:yes stop_codon:yes gene_type:complete